MAFSTAQRLQELGVATPLARELGAQIDASSYNWQRLMWASMPVQLAKYLADTMSAGTFDPKKAAELGMVPAVVRLVASTAYPTPTDPDAIAYISRSASPVSARRKSLIDTLFKSLKASGVYQKLDYIYDLSAETETLGLLNLKGVTGTLSKSGTVTHTPNIGMQGNGTDGYLAGLVPGANWILNSASAWVWDNLPDTRTANFALGTSSSTFRLRARQITIEAPAGYINDGTADAGANGSGRLPGLTGVNRDGASSKQIVRDATDVATVTTAATTITNQAIWIGRSGSSYSLGQHAFSAWGAGLTSGERAALWVSVRDYLVAVMRPIFCFGDSLTWGQVGPGVQAAQPWPARCQAALGRLFFNAGVPGETSTAIAAREAFDAVTMFGSGIAIIEAGRNNFTSPSTVKADIASMVARQTNGRFIIVGVLPWSSDSPADVATRLQLNADLASLYGNKYLDWLPALQSANDGSANDLADVTAGLTPRSLRYDAGHITDVVNSAGYSGIGVVAALVQQKIAALAW